MTRIAVTESSFAQLTRVLYEATCRGVQYDRDERALAFALRCLRCGDGEESISTDVRLRFDEICCCGIGFEPRGVRRSSYRKPTRAELVDLVGRIDNPQMLEWTIDDEASICDALSCPGFSWLLGNERAYCMQPAQIIVKVEGLAWENNYGEVVIAFTATSMHCIDDKGDVLMDDWLHQFEQWWRQWNDQWISGDAEGDFAAFIPAAANGPMDRHYPRPDEPWCALLDHDLPAELEALVHTWATARHETWDPEFDVEFPYVRSVDSWWIEGSRGSVTLRGIEHHAPCDEYPAENLEAVWELALRLRHGKWCVGHWSMALPRYGGAPAVPESAKPWLNEWSSGTIEPA